MEKNTACKPDIAEDRAPWYVVFCRFVFVMSILALFFIMFVGLVLGALTLVGEVMGVELGKAILDWSHNNPVISVIVAIVGYLVFICWFAYEFVSNLSKKGAS